MRFCGRPEGKIVYTSPILNCKPLFLLREKPQIRTAPPRPHIITYVGPDGSGSVAIPPELVGDRDLLSYLPLNTIEDLTALIAAVDRYNAAKQRKRYV